MGMITQEPFDKGDILEIRVVLQEPGKTGVALFLSDADFFDKGLQL
jgi:hypothetical protein